MWRAFEFETFLNVVEEIFGAFVRDSEEARDLLEGFDLVHALILLHVPGAVAMGGYPRWKLRLQWSGIRFEFLHPVLPKE